MLMNKDWPENRAYIERKYDERRYNADTGLSNAQIRAGLDKMLQENEHLSHTMLKAQGFAYVLENTRIDVDEHDWFIGLGEWSEKSMDASFCGHWLEEVREESAPLLMQQNEKMRAAWAYQSYLDYCHSVPDWERVLSLGFSGLRRQAGEYRAQREVEKGTLSRREREYFESIEIEYAAIDRFIARLRDQALVKDNDKCRRIAECLEHIRTGAPDTVYEVLQTIWLYFLLSEYVDCLQVRSFGNLDVVLYPYYQRDLERGVTREETADVLAAFLMQASAMRYYWGHPFYMGGTAEDGQSLINDMSFLILDVYDELGIYDPKVQIKLDRNTPPAFVKRVLAMIRGGHSSFNFVGERAMRRAMLKEGYTSEEARRAVVKGCYEYTACDGSVDTANVHVNLPKAIELALHDGYDMFHGVQIGPHTGRAEDFETFEAFYEAFMAQARFAYETGLAALAAYDARVGAVNPTPMFSATIRTSLEMACDAYSGGTKHRESEVLLCCPATAADSLCMVKKYVYDQKQITLAEMRDILDKNWEGAEVLRRRILNDRDKWGNNRDLPDSLFKDMTERLARLNNGRLSARGGYCVTSLHNALMFRTMGEHTAATPDGRFSGEECSKNASPVQGMAREGATATIASISKLDSSLFRGDFPLDIALSPNAVRGAAGLDAMYALLMTYADNYGHAIHFNVVSPETLRDAQRHPDKHRDLQIRVCGWNVLWNNLSADEQEYYIRQAEAAQ